MLLVGEVTPGNSFLWHGRVVGELACRQRWNWEADLLGYRTAGQAANQNSVCNLASFSSLQPAKRTDCAVEAAAAATVPRPMPVMSLAEARRDLRRPTRCGRGLLHEALRPSVGRSAGLFAFVRTGRGRGG
jgi:hypothetical protein